MRMLAHVVVGTDAIQRVRDRINATGVGMADTPLVSIGLSFRNARSSLAMSIRSVQNQTFRDWEMILVDDGSDDDSGSIAATFAAKDARITFKSDGKRLGLPSRLNQIIALSRGPFFARMDSDDLCFPARLESQLAILSLTPELDLVGGRALVFRDDGELLGRLPFRETHAEIVSNPWNWIPLVHPTWLGRRSWFLRFPYDPRFKKAQDQELLLRSFSQSRFHCCLEPVLAYRQDRLSMSKIIATRYYHGRALLQQFLRTRSAPFLFGAGSQLGKMSFDGIAIFSGLHHKLLPHRALPLLEGDQDSFDLLWASVRDPSCAA
jgi:glycosyltransferase involved in cell wall biosynthesis